MLYNCIVFWVYDCTTAPLRFFSGSVQFTLPTEFGGPGIAAHRTCVDDSLYRGWAPFKWTYSQFFGIVQRVGNVIEAPDRSKKTEDV